MVVVEEVEVGVKMKEDAAMAEEKEEDPCSVPMCSVVASILIHC